MATARSAAPRTSGAEAPPGAPRGRLVKPPSAVVPTGRAATVLPPGAACASGVRAAPDGAIGAANGKDDSYEDDELPKLEPEAGSVGAGDRAGAGRGVPGGRSRGRGGAAASFPALSTSAGPARAGTGSACPATVTEPIVNEAVPGLPIAWRAVHIRFDSTTSGAPLEPPRTRRPRVTVDEVTPPSAEAWLSLPVTVRTPGTPSSGPLTRARDAGALDACASSHAGVGAEGAAGGVAEAAMGSRDTSGWSRSSAVIGVGRSGRGTGALEAAA